MAKQAQKPPWRGKALLDKALIPVHAIASKPAQRLYLSSFLFVVTSLFLLASSSVAYAIFYYNYVPQIGVERSLHLQFGNGNPYGTASLSSALTSFQPYDITIFLHLPRTPTNIAAGNFMIDLSLISPETLGSTTDKHGLSASASNTPVSVIARSRRPAILTYVSPMVDIASTLSGLLWYILGWKKESEALEVSMFEGVEFGKGRKNIPQAVRVVIEADEKMQFYDLRVKIIAKLGGLRWFLYHHRIISFAVFTTIFWIISITSALASWFILSLSSSSPSPPSSSSPQHPPSGIKSEPEDPTIKLEPSDSETFDPFSTEDLSDTSRSFPTFGRQTPLLFSARKELRLKEEQREREAMKEEEKFLGGSQAPTVATAAAAAAEADDEDEDEDEADDIVIDSDMIRAGTGGWRDSGMGTSLDDGGTEVGGRGITRGRGSGRRRRGYAGDGEGLSKQM